MGDATSGKFEKSGWACASDGCVDASRPETNSQDTCVSSSSRVDKRSSLRPGLCEWVVG